MVPEAWPHLPPFDPAVRLVEHFEGQVLVEGRRELFALDAVTGRIRWSIDFDSRLVAIAFEKRVLYVASAASVIAVSASSGRRLWSSRHALKDPEGLILAGSRVLVRAAAEIAAFDKRDGRSQWRRESEADIISWIALGELLLLSALNGEWVYLRLSDGSETARTPGEFVGRFDSSKELLLAQEAGPAVTAMSVTTSSPAETLWRRDGVLEAVFDTGTVAIVDGARVRYLSADSGAEGAHITVDVNCLDYRQAGDALLVACPSGEGYFTRAYDSRGRLLWAVQLSGKLLYAKVTPKLFVLASKEGSDVSVVGLSRKGEVMWKSRIPPCDLQDFSPDSSLLFSNAGRVIMLDGASGKKLWTFVPPKPR